MIQIMLRHIDDETPHKFCRARPEDIPAIVELVKNTGDITAYDYGVAYCGEHLDADRGYYEILLDHKR